MPFTIERSNLARIGLQLAVASAVITAVLSFAHGIVLAEGRESMERARWTMFETWIYDFRYFFEQLIYVGALVFVAGKFLETRTMFSVGFSDAKNILAKGPDDDNVVWVGHRYASRLEAEAAADAIAARVTDR